MSALKNIIVIGGSGNVGREILAALLARKDQFGTISALKRAGFPTSDVLRQLKQQGVHILEANLKDKDSLVPVFKGTNKLSAMANSLVRCRRGHFHRQCPSIQRSIYLP
jgi:uncharacterized protein YbjT (DUF2867 family)